MSLDISDQVMRDTHQTRNLNIVMVVMQVSTTAQANIIRPPL